MTSPPPAAASAGHRVFLHAYGCQMNKLDGELALAALRAAGYVEVATPDEADVILYNTCSVRAHAEEKVYSNLGQLKRVKKKRPEVIIGVLGCMAQKDRGRIFERAPHVDIVCGTGEFPAIAALIEEARRGGRVQACGGPGEIHVARNVAWRPSRWQAFVAIMRGCDNYCSYCVVPFVRGREVSRPMPEVVDEVRRLAEDGCREVTLLGQNVNSYGKSFGRPGAFPELLGELAALRGLDRLRFVTSHPKDISRETLAAMRDLPQVCEHLHMPAQSGCDRILAAMNRKYTSARYRELVALAREMVHGIAVASDFIVGFPGETAEEFEQTAELMRDLRFQTSFVFKYSARPGTKAAELPDDVPFEEKRRRNLALLDIQLKINAEEHRRFIGKSVEALVEGASKRDAARLSGRSRTNQIVVFRGAPELAGRLVNVKITETTALTLAGTFEPDPDQRAGGGSEVPTPDAG